MTGIIYLSGRGCLAASCQAASPF